MLEKIFNADVRIMHLRDSSYEIRVRATEGDPGQEMCYIESYWNSIGMSEEEIEDKKADIIQDMMAAITTVMRRHSEDGRLIQR